MLYKEIIFAIINSTDIKAFIIINTDLNLKKKLYV